MTSPLTFRPLFLVRVLQAEAEGILGVACPDGACLGMPPRGAAATECDLGGNLNLRWGRRPYPTPIFLVGKAEGWRILEGGAGWVVGVARLVWLGFPEGG